MGQDQRSGVVGEGSLDDLAGVHTCPVNGAVEQLLVIDQPVPIVEEQAGEDFRSALPSSKEM